MSSIIAIAAFTFAALSNGSKVNILILKKKWQNLNYSRNNAVRRQVSLLLSRQHWEVSKAMSAYNRLKGRIITRKFAAEVGLLRGNRGAL